MFLAHQILYFESMCISFSKGCSDIRECEEEVFEVMGRYSTPMESLVKVLRIFKLYLKEGDNKQCFSAEEILDELPYNYNGENALKDTRYMFSVIMGRVFEGNCIDVGESTSDFLDDIFHHYGDNCSPYMSLGGLKRIIHDLQSGNGKGKDHDHSHHHSHHHDNAHEDVHECDHIHGHFAHNHDHDHGHNHLDHYHHGHPHYDHDHNDSHSNFGYHHDHDHDHDHSNHDHSGHHHTQYDHTSLQPSTRDSTTNINLKETTVSVHKDVTTEPTIAESLTTTPVETEKKNLKKVSTELHDLQERKRSSIPPASSLRSDLSHQEEKHRIDDAHHHPSSDDVKKVYLLQNEEHNRYLDLEPSGIPHQFASLASKCLSAEELIQKFGHQENSTLTKSDFIELCPALVQQIVSGVLL
ncbi:zinc transporter ZIP12 [Caerostris extrusa]|uniref:Zinc transporter ZIP12 n=1 Tax=Caerostris extrusa TaxID=172846 RepID=A0AAV4TBP6_CAEEX|nr:zinc transporter ZIP12 [Caerostris extrusa]